jgi:formamidopyrimidine-DNA glycosylase
MSPIDDEEFTLESFNMVLDEGGANIVKKVLLNQWKIAGIGNGYCQDILFRARIHPKRKVNDLNAKERKTLYSTIKDILNEAARLGGSDSERDLYDHQGGYRRLMGEGAKGKPCPKCGTAIEKISLLGSSSYICPSCQK